MFKKILSAFLGSMAAIWISAIVIFFLFIMMIGAVVGDSGTVKVSEHSILHLDLSGVIDEKFEKVNVQEVLMGGGEMPQHLDEYLEALDVAAGDPNIDGVFVDCGGSVMGYAAREELAAAIARFKKSGKWVYAYADSYTQGDYYVACGADKVVLNPVGMVDVHGVGSNIPFFKTLLDKLGVEVQVLKVGEFKSAVEPFILTEPSEPSRRQTEVYTGAIWNNIATTIAANRKVEKTVVDAWADSVMLTVGAEELLEARVVDELKYRRQAEEELRSRVGIDKTADLPLVTPADYLASDPRVRVPRKEDSAKNADNDGYFAVLYAVGDIVDAGKEGIVGPRMVSQIVDLADDAEVKGLVLRVNSGGGSAFASEQIWEALEYFKSTGKPFYVSMGDYAASGGYYISCGADEIYCDANTLTGSIGIFGVIPCVKELLNDKVGVNIATIGTGPNVSFPSMVEPMSPEQRRSMQGYIERGYKLFTSRVAESRKLPIDSVLTIAEGRVWAGNDALAIGLVDKIGGVDDAIAAMAAKLNMSADNYVSYPEVKMTAVEELVLNAAGADMTAAVRDSYAEALPEIEGVDVATVARYMRMLRRVKEMGNIQARMETVSLE